MTLIEKLKYEGRDESGKVTRPLLIDAATELERLQNALEEISDAHIPDQPAAADGDELVWAQRHVGKLRRIALNALSQ